MIRGSLRLPLCPRIIRRTLTLRGGPSEVSSTCSAYHQILLPSQIQPLSPLLCSASSETPPPNRISIPLLPFPCVRGSFFCFFPNEISSPHILHLLLRLFFHFLPQIVFYFDLLPSSLPGCCSFVAYRRSQTWRRS